MSADDVALLFGAVWLLLLCAALVGMAVSIHRTTRMMWMLRAADLARLEAETEAEIGVARRRMAGEGAP